MRPGCHCVMKWKKEAKEGIVVAGGQGEGNSTTQLSSLRGIVVDTESTLYLAEAGNHRVNRWYKGVNECDIIVRRNGEGAEAHQLNNPIVITGTLHMKLRISDVLLAEIILLISVTDTIAEHAQHLKNVMTFLEQRAKDTNTNKFTLTKKNEIEVAGRLNAQMHERFLRDIPLYAIIKDNQKTFFIRKLCDDFFDLMKLYSITDIFQHVKKQSIDWCERYKILFGSDAVTIYIQVLGNHAFEFHEEYNNLALYSLQGNEKFNDITTKDFFMSTNKRNFNVQLLQKRVRLRLLGLGLQPQGAVALKRLFFNWSMKDSISAEESILNKFDFLNDDIQRIYV
ncbi:unnamed protein product [Didymodactylos carnosus]|uniref:Uncharacterized protein n=1 Tax=Didymodactylos carnosus TaxID=1234261 RepID=A0A815T0Y9_9BILA|nr:unnamed protein product [Didymodactylos carnosus]CAF1499118.1 unnamed protein product [Didymodactylos carnosus]CAF4280874.1 unnamed protein product [Didymodactylos carnosus]CAF4361080.1 unnamed protein product [Didymodactylos carnosus]